MTKPDIKAFFDEATNTISYVVSDPATNKCAVIDALLDYDASSGRMTTESADVIISHIKKSHFEIDWIIDTHVHADHISGAHYVKQKIGGRTAIGDRINDVQRVFGEVFNAGQSFRTDGSQFDHLFKADEKYKLGEIEAVALHTPGHTPACMTHVFGDAGFVGDTLFMPDFGTARCDFPGGDAAQLFQSIQKIFALPDQTRLFMCHDYKAPGRDIFAWETTVVAERERNIHVGAGASEASFVKMRKDRDATLNMPNLILPSVQVNMRAGDLPPVEDNGVSYLKIPVNTL